DLMGNGYISYQRRNEETGLENQCWKDSWDSISYHDGRLPGFPRATAELQGYAYDAKVRGARLARTVWRDADLAGRLERGAGDLKRRFNRDFWVKKGGYYALALDSDGEQVDALASNNGHLLWSGIVDKSKAKAVARHLMGPRLFSGWGVRTLAEGEGRYNPIGYHVGTVWPFDNSFIAWGLRNYGFKEEAARIAAGILDAAEFFDGRLPEAFGGYDRTLTKYPVQYPTACSPQAWSTGAPLLFLRTMLGLEPLGDNLVVDPALPADIGHLELLDIPARWGRLDAFAPRRVQVDKRPSALARVGSSDCADLFRKLHAGFASAIERLTSKWVRPCSAFAALGNAVPGPGERPVRPRGEDSLHAGSARPSPSAWPLPRPRPSPSLLRASRPRQPPGRSRVPGGYCPMRRSRSTTARSRARGPGVRCSSSVAGRPVQRTAQPSGESMSPPPTIQEQTAGADSSHRQNLRASWP